jgi:two-component sensor histidine kinase
VREGERAMIDGPALRLRPKAAQVLALALHELVSNGVEHGTLDGIGGRVEVRWQVAQEGDRDCLSFSWRERGGDGRVTPPTRRGFGCEVLETMLAYELGARTTLAFEPDGLACHIRFPFDPWIGRLAGEERQEER